MNEMHSIIIIPVPDAENIVKELRVKYDPAELEGVPAHITILFPFYTLVELTEAKMEQLKTIFTNTAPFQFSLTSIDTFPNVVFLKPDPIDNFVKLTEKVVESFPDKPPYEGKYDSINPHLTIAQVFDGQDFETIKKDIELKVSDKLPITTKVHEALLMIEDADGNWTKKENLPFRLK